MTSPDTSPTQSQGLNGRRLLQPDHLQCGRVGRPPPRDPRPPPWPSSGTAARGRSCPARPTRARCRPAVAGESCVTDWACVAVGSFYLGACDAGRLRHVHPHRPLGLPLRGLRRRGVRLRRRRALPRLHGRACTSTNPSSAWRSCPAVTATTSWPPTAGSSTTARAQFYGSAGAIHLNKPIVGMAVTAGRRRATGSSPPTAASSPTATPSSTARPGPSTLNKPIVGMAATPDGQGYWPRRLRRGDLQLRRRHLLRARRAGSPLNKPVVGMAAPVGGGYYLVASDGGIFSFPTTNGPPFLGSTGVDQVEQAHRGHDDRARRLLPERLRRRRLRVPDHERPTLLGLDRARSCSTSPSSGIVAA